MGQNEVELLCGEGDFGHVEAQPELVFGDVPVAELVEVLHEFGYSNSPFLDNPPDPSEEVVQVLRNLASDDSLVGPRLLLEVLEGVGVSEREDFPVLVVLVDVVDELVVVDFVEVASVHVLFEEEVGGSFALGDEVELLQDPGELVLGDVADLGDVEVLKQGLHVDPFVGDGLLVVFEELVQLGLLLGSENDLDVLDWLEHFFGDLGYSMERVFVQPFLSEY